MNWPLKLQGRFVTEVEVNEIRMLLGKYPLWNRSRLSQELCVRWKWQRPPTVKLKTWPVASFFVSLSVAA